MRLYARWRFLSEDEIHSHFRMAAFVKLGKSRNALDHDEIDLNGEQSGAQAGIIATKLMHKLALSATGSFVQVLTPKPLFFPKSYAYQSVQYSFSAGYLLFPRNYKDYHQTNINLYCELLGMNNTDRKRYTIDIGPAIQFIFNSATRINIGARYELTGNMYRMERSSVLLSVEHYFLNAFKRNR
jgi:hypothetical protein